MYESPKLEKFGAFRQLTLQGLGKNVIGDDLVPNIGLDCNSDPNSGQAACLRS